MKNYESISDRIRIYVNDQDKKYGIVDIKNYITIFSDIKYLDTAIEMKKAYCYGYIDRKNEEKDND